MSFLPITVLHEINEVNFYQNQRICLKWYVKIGYMLSRIMVPQDVDALNPRNYEYIISQGKE